MKEKHKKLLLKLIPFVLVIVIYLVLPKNMEDAPAGSSLMQTGLPTTESKHAGDTNAPSGSSTPNNETSAASFRVHILDVGQALSILVEAGDDTLLYDGGDKETCAFLLSYLQSQGIRDLDYVIASHYDSDHLVGVTDVLRAYEIGTLLGPDYEADTTPYKNFAEAVKTHKLTVTHPTVNQVLPLGDGTIRILAPTSESYKNENDFSIVVQLSLGDSSLLITGDATSNSEAEMLAGLESLESDVLVVGHHGSYSSTSQDFFDAVSPEHAIISCGADNEYGYPHQRVTELLQGAQIPVYRTDLQGTICFTMTAEDIVFDTTHPEAVDTENYSIFPYVLNTYRMKFHLPGCESITETSARNKQGSNLSRETLIDLGYSPCGSCAP